jgi:hypothetical protein
MGLFLTLIGWISSSFMKGGTNLSFTQAANVERFLKEK